MNDVAKKPIFWYCCMTEYDNLACMDVVHLVAFGCDGWSWYLLLKFVFDWCHICVILVNIYIVMLFFFEIQMKCCQNFEFYVVPFLFHLSNQTQEWNQPVSLFCLYQTQEWNGPVPLEWNHSIPWQLVPQPNTHLDVRRDVLMRPSTEKRQHE